MLRPPTQTWIMARWSPDFCTWGDTPVLSLKDRGGRWWVLTNDEWDGMPLLHAMGPTRDDIFEWWWLETVDPKKATQ